MNGDREQRHNEKHGSSILHAAAGLIYSILQSVSKGGKRSDQAEQANRRIANATLAVAFLTLGLLVVSAFTCGVLIKQWQIFESTDKTLRVGERAFVYIDGGIDSARNNDGSGDKWTFLFNAINNGGTQTKNLSFVVACEYGSSISIPPIATSFLGPKQRIGMGSCTWSDDIIQTIWANNWSVKVTVSIFYLDTFSDAHFTRVCRRIFPKSDPRNGPPLQHEDDRCSESPDCADKECFP